MDRNFLIIIDDATYTARVRETSHYATLEKHGADTDPYLIEWDSGYREALTSLSANPGFSCECEDFEHRHAGTSSDGCKHIQGLCGDRRFQAILDAQRDEEAHVARDDYAGQVLHDYLTTR